MESTRIIYILALLASLLIVANLVLGTITLNKVNSQANRNAAFIQCVSNWASGTAARSAVLTDLSATRQDRLDILIRDFSLAGSKDPKVKAHLKKVFFQHLHSYITVSNKYRKALQKHPLPKSPKFACANVKK